MQLNHYPGKYGFLHNCGECFNVMLNHLFHVLFTSDTYDQDRRAIILTRAIRARFIILDEENMHVNNYFTMILILSYLRCSTLFTCIPDNLTIGCFLPPT